MILRLATLGISSVCAAHYLVAQKNLTIAAFVVGAAVVLIGAVQPLWAARVDRWGDQEGRIADVRDARAGTASCDAPLAIGLVGSILAAYIGGFIGIVVGAVAAVSIVVTLATVSSPFLDAPVTCGTRWRVWFAPLPMAAIVLALSGVFTAAISTFKLDPTAVRAQRACTFVNSALTAQGRDTAAIFALWSAVRTNTPESLDAVPPALRRDLSFDACNVG